LAVAGIVLAWRSAALPFGTLALPGPGFFPLFLGIALAFLALIIVVANARRPQAGKVLYLGNRRIAVTLGGLAGVAVAFEILGAYATLGLFMAMALAVVARAPVWKAFLAAALGTIAVWAFFKVVLGLQLPAGPF
jgi:putative tricarboxylic transport membrane protein